MSDSYLNEFVNIGYAQGYRDGELKGRADALGEVATRLEEELIMVMPRDEVKFLMYKVHTVLEQLKEQNKWT